MAGEAGIEADMAGEAAKIWRPSGQPAHRLDEPSVDSRVVEQLEQLSLPGLIGQFLKRPFVRLVIGLGIFILAAIVYDNTVNFGEWTERKERPRPTQHRGLDPIRQTPEG